MCRTASMQVGRLEGRQPVGDPASGTVAPPPLMPGCLALYISQASLVLAKGGGERERGRHMPRVTGLHGTREYVPLSSVTLSACEPPPMVSLILSRVVTAHFLLLRLAVIILVPVGE